MEDGFPEHVWVDVPTSGADPLERALDFLGTYAHLYLDDPVQELILDTHDIADGWTSCTSCSDTMGCL